MRKIKNFVWKILNYTSIGPVVELYLSGELKNNGWFQSFRTKKSVDAAGNPIPWYTYSANDFLTEHLESSMLVFEYGSGGSTKWLAPKIKHITAVEDHKEWKEFVEKEMPQNVSLIYQPIDDQNSYAKAIQKLSQKFDVVIVDGKERNECVKHCLSNLSDTGIIILDDSFREEYQASFKFLETKGFKKLNFWGMKSVVSLKSCTTVFYRSANVFNI